MPTTLYWQELYSDSRITGKSWTQTNKLSGSKVVSRPQGRLRHAYVVRWTRNTHTELGHRLGVWKAYRFAVLWEELTWNSTESGHRLGVGKAYWLQIYGGKLTWNLQIDTHIAVWESLLDCRCKRIHLRLYRVGTHIGVCESLVIADVWQVLGWSSSELEHGLGFKTHMGL